MNTEDIINVKNLTVTYDDDIILDDISFQVKRGDIFAITGPSGCGKTTLLNHMIGLRCPHSGMIHVDGYNVMTDDEKKKKAFLQNIGVMYQSGALFGSSTILENVRFPLQEMTKLPLSAMNAIAFNKLRMVNMLHAAYKLPSELSGGMKKRAAIARALALDPYVLFLDEPAAGLDPVTRHNLDHLIKQLAKSLNLTFVIVTHEIATIMTIADDMIMLHDKKIIAHGPPKQLIQEKGSFVQEFFEKGVSHIDG